MIQSFSDVSYHFRCYWTMEEHFFRYERFLIPSIAQDGGGSWPVSKPRIGSFSATDRVFAQIFSKYLHHVVQ